MFAIVKLHLAGALDNTGLSTLDRQLQHAVIMSVTVGCHSHTNVMHASSVLSFSCLRQTNWHVVVGQAQRLLSAITGEGLLADF